MAAELAAPQALHSLPLGWVRVQSQRQKEEDTLLAHVVALTFPGFVPDCACCLEVFHFRVLDGKLC